MDERLFADGGYFGEVFGDDPEEDYWEDVRFHGFVFRRDGTVSFFRRTESNHHLTTELREGTCALAPGGVAIHLTRSWLFSDVDWGGTKREITDLDERETLEIEETTEGPEFWYDGARFGLLRRNPFLNPGRGDLERLMGDCKLRARPRD